MSVELDGAQLAGALRGKQVPLLLAYMLLNRTRHVGREELIGALWPDRPPVSQDAALRTLLSRLRSALGASVLVGRDELILALPDPVWIDVEAAGVEMERAREALSRNDARTAWALAQVPLNIATRGLLPGAQAPWLESRRRELEDLGMEALEVIGQAGLRLGGSQLASAERAARTLIEREPFRESGYVLQMQVLSAEGNVAEALRVFERLRKLLREELGTAPSPETLAAHDRLLHAAGAASAAGAADAVGAPAGRATRVPLPPELAARASGPLVGRVQELDSLRRIWEAVAASDTAADRPDSRLVLLAGEPGIGKTRLAAELAARADDAGGIVLAGRSPEESLAPYQPFLEALRHYVLNVSLHELGVSAQEYGAELSRLMPELRRRAPGIPAPLAAQPETERYRLFEAVAGLLAHVSAAAPLLLVLDDLHWADRPTLLLLRHVARVSTSDRLMILGTYRAADARTGAFAEMLADLRREPRVAHMSLGGLALGEAAELIRALTGAEVTPDFCRALHEETDGNPFFLEEMVRHIFDQPGVEPERATANVLRSVGLPAGVTDVIAQRVARLQQPAQESLRVAAVIGRDFDASLLEAVVRLGEDEFLSALDETLASGLVMESPGGPGHYSFSHALIRTTLYDNMSALRRARIHRLVGEVLESANGDRHLEALAHHFARAEGPEDAERAIDYAIRAGEQASSMLAHEEAADHYARALQVLERFTPMDDRRRGQLLVMLAEARVRTGDRQQGWETFRQAAAVARKLGDSVSLARVAIGASRPYIQQPGVVDEELIAMLEEALEATTGKRTITRVRLLGRLCGALYYAPGRARMKELSAEADAIAAELGDVEARSIAAAARRRALWEPAHLDDRLAASTELLTLARQAGNLELSLQGHAWLAVDLLELGDREGVDAQVQAFIAGAQALREPVYVWSAAVWKAMLALLDGQIERADELAHEALATATRARSVSAAQYFAIQLLAIRHEQDRGGELEPAARQFVKDYPTVPAWRAALARILADAGRTQEARRELDTLAANDFEDIPPDANWMIAVTLLGELCAELGDAERAARLCELLTPYRDVNILAGVGAVCLGSAARYLGILAATCGDRKTAAEHFERALERNAALKAPVCLAHTQLDYARMLGPGKRKAISLIDAAARTAQELELPAVTRRAGELRGA